MVLAETLPGVKGKCGYGPKIAQVGRERGDREVNQKLMLCLRTDNCVSEIRLAA